MFEILLVLSWVLVGVWLVFYTLTHDSDEITVADVYLSVICGSLLGYVAILYTLTEGFTGDYGKKVLWRKGK